MGNGQRAFFFGNWITESNTENTGKFIAKAKVNLKKGFAPKAEADEASADACIRTDG